MSERFKYRSYHTRHFRVAARGYAELRVFRAEDAEIDSGRFSEILGYTNMRISNNSTSNATLATPKGQGKPGKKVNRQSNSLAPSTRRSNAERLTVERVTAAIEKTFGNLSVAARTLSVHRSCLYRFLHRHEDLKEVLHDMRETAIDNVESALYNAAIGGNVPAMIYFLKCQGKSRGWVERSEVSATPGEPIRILVEYGQAPTIVDDQSQVAGITKEERE